MEIWEQPDEVRIAAAQHRWLAQLQMQHPALVSRLYAGDRDDELAPAAGSSDMAHTLPAAA